MLGRKLAEAEIDLDAIEEWTWGRDPLATDGSAPAVLESDGEGGLQFRFAAPMAMGVGYQGLERRYTVETSTTLATDGWEPLLGCEDIAADGGEVVVLLDASEPRRFYRLISRLVPSGGRSP